MSFLVWQELEPVQRMSRRLGFRINNCVSWANYREEFRNFNNLNQNCLVEIAGNNLNSGEHSVLLAMLHAAGLSARADELSLGGTWALLDDTSGKHKVAVIYAIARLDRTPPKHDHVRNIGSL